MLRILKSLIAAVLLLSLAVVLYRMYRSGNLVVPPIYHSGFLILSVCLLLGGFVADAAVWHYLAKVFGFRIRFRDTFVGSGLFGLTKYLPGKVWFVLGRAGYITKTAHKPLGEGTYLIILSQILLLLTGFAYIPLMAFTPARWLNYWALLGFAVLAVLIIINIRPVLRLGFRWYRKLNPKSDLNPVELSRANIYTTLALSLLVWLCWNLGFYFLLRSTHTQAIPWASLGVFSIATCAGMLALVVPGGIGVREGAMVLLLLAVGLTNQQSTQIAVAGRLWFLLGEISMFVISGLLHLKRRYVMVHTSPIPKSTREFTL